MDRKERNCSQPPKLKPIGEGEAISPEWYDQLSLNFDGENFRGKGPKSLRDPFSSASKILDRIIARCPILPQEWAALDRGTKNLFIRFIAEAHGQSNFRGKILKKVREEISYFVSSSQPADLMALGERSTKDSEPVYCPKSSKDNPQLKSDAAATEGLVLELKNRPVRPSTVVAHSNTPETHHTVAGGKSGNRIAKNNFQNPVTVPLDSRLCLTDLADILGDQQVYSRRKETQSSATKMLVANLVKIALTINPEIDNYNLIQTIEANLGYSAAIAPRENSDVFKNFDEWRGFINAIRNISPCYSGIIVSKLPLLQKIQDLFRDKRCRGWSALIVLDVDSYKILLRDPTKLNVEEFRARVANKHSGKQT